MTTQTTTSKRINADIYEILENSALVQVEVSPEAQDLFRRRKELVAMLEGDAANIGGKLSDLCMEFACTYADAMFRRGLELGREPQRIFDLPELVE